MTERKKYQSVTCSAVMGTLTNAQKAQKVLAAAAIPSSVTKSESSLAHRGCVWCVNFACNQSENVRAVFEAAGVNAKSWSVGDDILR